MDELRGGPLLAERLDKAVREVCPIHGVSIGRRVDETGAWARDTWRVNPKPEATLEEIRAAYDVLASFDPDAEATPAPTPEPHNFPANMSDKLSDWDTGADENSLTTADLTEDVIQRLTKDKRKKFTELLNVELAELQQERGGPREALSREAEIEKLLGLFARVGEM
jgi:hypothetical protein